MKFIFASLLFFISLTANANNYQCKSIGESLDKKVICFEVGHVCIDPHGIGDGNPIPTDCWTGGSRACNSSRDNWPDCAGGFLAE